MQLPSELSDAQSAAVVQCLQLFAARGRALRLAREQREQKDTSAEMLGSDAADVSEIHGTPLLPKDDTDAEVS